MTDIGIWDRATSVLTRNLVLGGRVGADEVPPYAAPAPAPAPPPARARRASLLGRCSVGGVALTAMSAPNPAPGSPSADGLKLLASWAATLEGDHQPDDERGNDRGATRRP